MSFLSDLWSWFFPSHNNGGDTPVVVDADQALLKLHNNQRGVLYALANNDKLKAAATLHAEWMARNHAMRHDEGHTTVADRVKSQGYAWNYVGENIAMGYPDADAVFQGWMNSPGHRANIMNKNYKDIGFGVAKASDGTLYWCAVFGRQY